MRSGILLITTMILLGFNPADDMAYVQPTSQSDIHHNTWVIASNAAHRISNSGEILATYSNVHLGTPTSVDSTNPFRVMLFYQQHQQLIIVNNHATAIGTPINLSELIMGEITLACRSVRGGVWLYHRDGHELLQTNPQATRIEKRISLPQGQLSGSPNRMLERNGIIYLGIANNHIERVDSYGTTLEPISISYHEWFWVDDTTLWTHWNDYVEKRQLAYLNKKPELFHCPNNSSPLIINGKPLRYENKKLLHCEKLDQ
ncbi:MAG: hypothetical protein PHT92_02560 [Bacteroidales bacterium]|nr:hypothetical protein [Bacteroidales bacterium]